MNDFAWAEWGLYTVSYITMILSLYYHTHTEKLPELNKILILVSVITSGLIFAHSHFGRTDVVLYALFFLSISAVLYERYFILFILSGTAMMVHEGYFFFLWIIPLFFILVRLIYKEIRHRTRAVACIISCFILALIQNIWFHFLCYKVYDNSKSVAYFIAKTRADRINVDQGCRLMIIQEFTGKLDVKAWFMYYSRELMLTLCIISIVIALPLFITFMKLWIRGIKNNNGIFEKLICIFGLCIWASMIPLFIFAIDYGRWIIYILVQQLFMAIIASRYIRLDFKYPCRYYPAIQSIISTCGTAWSFNALLECFAISIFSSIYFS